jgi:predicted ribosome quality control (RQC) complex YloA/Tae2 family protein
MKNMSGLEVHRLLKSVKLGTCRIGKVFRQGDVFAFEITGEKKFLIARPGGFYPSNYAPRGEADAFCMFLRKRLTGQIIRAAAQHNVDRVIFLDFDNCRLVFELFGRMNIILVEEGRVAGSLRKCGKVYVPPESIDYLSIPESEFLSLIEGRTKTEVARLLGIGKLVETVWGDGIHSSLRGIAETPLSPDDVEKEFKAEDEKSLAEKKLLEINSKTRQMEKTVAELKNGIDESRAKAGVFRRAGRHILSNLPFFDGEIKKAFQKGEKRIKVTVPDN